MMESNNINFSALDRLNLEFLQGLYVSEDGNLWVNSRGRLLRYMPNLESSKKALNEPLLTTVKEIGSNRTLFNNTHFHFNQPNLKLFPHENAVGFYFNALNYSNKNTIEYRARLIGYNKNWSNWNREPFVQYTNIPNGHFTFEIQYRTNTVNLSPIAQIEINRLPYWYQKRWSNRNGTGLKSTPHRRRSWRMPTT